MNFYSIFENSYLFIAVVGSTIFIIQFIMSLMGLAHSDDASDFSDGADGADDSGLADLEASQNADALHVNFFSLKSIVAFFTFYGWGGVCFKHLEWGGFVIALCCGLLMMVILSLLFAFMMKMQQSGNITTSDYIGRQGTVYLTVPGNRAPGGKIIVKLPECTREIAVRSDTEITTGQEVVIIEAMASGVFLVKAIS